MKNGAKTKTAFRMIVRRIRDAAAISFDSSFVMRAAAFMRSYFVNLRLRSAGVFLFTFAFYSAAICLGEQVFSGAAASGTFFFNIFFCGAALVLSIPLLASTSTIGHSLVSSATGSNIIKCIGIRPESVRLGEPVGRANFAFIFGVLAGTLTLALEPYEITGAIAVLAASAVILTVPEAGAVFLALILPFGFETVCALTAAVSAISYAIKLLRGKRSVTAALHDKVAAVFFSSLVLGAFICIGGEADLLPALLILVYFIISFSFGHGDLGGRITSLAVASSGASAAVFSGFAVVAVMLSGGKLAFREAADQVSVFDETALGILFCALIPVAVSLMLSDRGLSKRTSFFCTVAMVAFLFISGYYVHLVAALAGTIAAIMFYNRRVAYLLFALATGAFVIWMWLGGTSSAVFGIIEAFLGRPEGSGVSKENFLFGEGLTGGFGHGGSFYMAVISRLGVFGMITLSALLILLVVYIINLAKNSSDTGNIYKKSCTPLCGVIALLVCGVRVNIFETGSVFLCFWMLLGACSAHIFEADVMLERALARKKNTKEKDRAQITLKMRPSQTGEN